ncbi:MAG: hypothetical protein ABIW80_07315 [Lapillicoccus sp.]
MTIVAHAHPLVINDIEIRLVLLSTNAIESLNAREVLGAVFGAGWYTAPATPAVGHR